NTDGVTLPYSEQAYTRSVQIGEQPKPSTPPSASVVTPHGPSRVEGHDFDVYRGGAGNVMQSARDGKTGDIIVNREIDANDYVTVRTNTGREMTVRVRMAEAEGFINRDPVTGKYRESDRAAQQAAVDALRKLEVDKANAEALTYTNEVEAGIADISQSL